MLETHLIFFGCWMAYYAIHSLLASDRVKAKVPLKAQVYRLLYSIVSTLLLLYVLILGAVQPTFPVLKASSNTKAVAVTLTIVGVFIVKRAFRNYSFRAFMGFKKETNEELKTDGLQARMRHPLYSGTILIVAGFFFFSPSMINLTTLISLLVYLPVGIWLEEKKLIKHFGQEYKDYQQQVPAIFPNPFRRK